MLPKEHRLRKDKDIKTLFNSGKSVFGVFLGLKVRKNRLAGSRFAVVVGTKVSKSAVARNRIRRQLREILRLRLTLMKHSFDVAVLVRPQALGKSYSELETALVSLLKRAGLL